MTNPSDVSAIHEMIDFGFEVEAFLQGKIGRYIVARAEAEIAEAVEALKRIDPNDANGVREQQARVYRAESIQFWLAEVIQEGINAQRELIERD